MNLIDFFDDEHDLADHIRLARDGVMPILEAADAELDPDRRVKLQTALFILLTFNAVKKHGLDKRTALRIVSNLIDTINSGAFENMRQ